MTRDVLNNRRTHERIAFEFWGTHFTVGIGRNVTVEDGVRYVGPVAEVFINSGKSGAQMETMSRDSAVLISLALQHGAPLETIRHALTRNVDGSPQGPIGHLLDLLTKAEGST